MDCNRVETRMKANNTFANSHGVQEKMEMPCSPLVLLELLKTCGDKKRLSGIKLIDRTCATPCNSSSSQAVSTVGIVKIARAKLFQYASQNSDIFSAIISSLDSYSGLSSKDYEDVELALLLQAAAEKLANHKFDRARKLLSMCEISASPTGNPVQRVVHYFAEALRERIDRETGAIPPGQGEKRKQEDVEKLVTSYLPAIISIQQQLPFSPVTQFTGIQAILDNVESANRIHLIDFGIKSGSQWTIIMQALTVRYEFPVEHLKITAVGNYRERLEMTGENLLSFAKSMKLPFSFSFKVVESEMKDLKKDMFELETGEAVAVYSELRLWSMLAYPNHLEAVLGLIRNLNPCIMVVVEGEVCTSQPTFLDRFNESLILSSALFDCVDTCMERDNRFRVIAEGLYLREMIHNINTAEGEERIHRYEKIDFWRAFFARFGIVEIELSQSSLYQASLVLKRSTRWSACNLDMNGQSLIMKWKDTPIQSLSAWKFQQQDLK